MGLRDLNIKRSYQGKGEKILADFLLPAIAESVRYDRVTSFFTIDSLLAISQGLELLFRRKGKMRLIIGIHSFPIEFVEASLRQKFLKNQIDRIRKEISDGIISLSDSLEKERLATIAWMIQDKLLEAKVVSIKGTSAGIFHPKTIILQDSNNDIIVASGSLNETRCGLGGNYEQLMVFRSWDGFHYEEDQEQIFNNLWNGNIEDLIVSEISEELADIIISSLGDDFNRLKSRHILEVPIIENAAKMPSNFFVSGDIPSLFVHQERAVLDALSRWPVRVMFSDEVGLGKTFEVSATMLFLKKYCNIKRILILVPKAIQLQWQDELKMNFGIDSWIYDSSNKCFVNYDGKKKEVRNGNPLSKDNPDIVLMSIQYARGRNKEGNIFCQTGTDLPELLIVDEAHAARVNVSFNGKKNKTLAYSMLEEISKKVPHIILATATPMQKNIDEYHSMLRLLGLPPMWNKLRNYQVSLNLIVDKSPDLSDATNAGFLLREVVTVMKPSLRFLSDKERIILANLVDKDFASNFEIGEFVQKNWNILQKVFIKFHPAHLMTIRNTRGALSQIGYKFPKRNLKEVSIENSFAIQSFYNGVDKYLEDYGFSIEGILNPDSSRNLGFAKSTYQQRVASSLHSCIKSLSRRLQKAESLRKFIKNGNCKLDNLVSFLIKEWNNDFDLDDYEVDPSYFMNVNLTQENLSELLHAAESEIMSLHPLIHKAEELKEVFGDLKINESISVALKHLSSGDLVLLFSRYTDTVEALIQEFESKDYSDNYPFGVYTGQESYICERGNKIECDKNQIRQALSTGRIRILFCSDAASEGLNLQAARVLINVDVPWTPARLEQRIGRVARLGQKAKEVDIYNIWYPNSVESRMYHRIQERLGDMNLVIGEFPEVIAEEIKESIFQYDFENNNVTDSLEELKVFRNSTQVKALERLWSPDYQELTVSDLIRKRLMEICKKCSDLQKTYVDGELSILLPDNTKILLTKDAGCLDTISLKSKIWKYLDINIGDISLIKNSEGLICSFANLENKRLIKFESIYKLCLNELLSDSDYLTGYPQMLPNNHSLSMQYATDKKSEPPNIWID